MAASKNPSSGVGQIDGAVGIAGSRSSLAQESVETIF